MHFRNDVGVPAGRKRQHPAPRRQTLHDSRLVRQPWANDGVPNTTKPMTAVATAVQTTVVAKKVVRKVT